MEFMRLLLLLILGLILAAPARAAGEFATSYNVDYRVSTDGLTRAKISVELVNKLSNVYASEFSLAIGSTNLTDIRLLTASGPIEPKISQGNKTTNISVIFPEKVLGKDKGQQFILEFTTTDFARRLGSVWEVSIPKLAKSEDLTSYYLTLTVPGSFGQPASLTPIPISQSPGDGVTVYRFGGDSLFKNGIAAIFGQQQWIDFSLNYHLKNPHFYPIETEIALPPDTAWQQVLYATIRPEPQSLRLDADGNWLAGYRLGVGAGLDIVATGSASLWLQPRADFPWGINQAVDYLQPLKYWEADQERIKSLAAGFNTSRDIYDYVVDNLIYDYGRLGSSPTRLGAANALDNPDSALCLEFTDLFIALARAAGIPARAVNGYAFTDNSALRPLSLKQDVLHAWPEYYNRERELWQPVDPTWGNTTGGVDFFSQTDLNHFAFVILGQNSNYPVPAGAYKNDDQPEKNISVTFGKTVSPSPAVELSFNLPQESPAGINLTGKIIVKNSGNVALYRLPLSLAGGRLKPSPQSWEISWIPPKGQAEVEFTLPASSWNSRLSEVLTAQTTLGQVSHRLNLVPAYSLVFGSQAFRLALLSLAGLIVLKLIYDRLVKAKPVK